MVHREKFCLVYRELLTGTGQSPRWLSSDAAWRELLLLPVNAVWLRKTLGSMTPAQLLRPVRGRGNQTAPLTHTLLALLLGSLRRDGDSVDAQLRQKHAVEALGVLTWTLLDRAHIDFKQQILVLFCRLENSDEFWASFIAQGAGILEAASVADGGDGERRDNYVRFLALHLFLTLATGCDNLQRNSLLDHFAVQHGRLLNMLDDICTKDRPLYQKEQGLALLTLLCNHRKHESRNPFRAHVRSMATNDAHMYMFTVREVLVEVNQLLVRCVAGTYSASAQDAFTELLESASDSVIAWGAQLGSAFGAWISGIDPAASARASSSVASSGSGASKKAGLATSPAPVLTGQGVECDVTLWWRARFALLSIYELLCGTGGTAWLRVCVEHDVPPWAADNGPRGSIPQPLACSDLFLSILQLVSFGLHSNAGHGHLATHVSLLIVRCITEDLQVGTLLFSFCLEEVANVNALHVFERKGARADGDMAYVAARRPSSSTQGAGASEDGEGGTAPRRRLQSSSLEPLDKSLAATLFRQLANVLIEHCQPERAAADAETESSSDSPSGAGGGGFGQPLDASPAPKRERKPRPGLLCVRVIECLHRLLLFEKRALTREKSSLLGVEWGLVSSSLFALMRVLSTGTDCFPDLTPARYLWLCRHLAHVVNLILSSDCQTDAERLLFIFQILSHRAEVDGMCRVLERDASLAALGGPRLLQHEVANLRTILLHFASVVMLIEQPAGGESPSAPATKQQQRERERALLSKLSEAAPSLKLRPHDRLRDGFQRYAETSEERALLREFVTQLVHDSKALRLFERAVKKKL